MTIDQISNLSPISLPGNLPGVSLRGGGHGFQALLSAQMSSDSKEPPVEEKKQSYVDTLKENGIIGFFKRLEAEKLEKLREKILEEMGLTEETLGKLSPQRRAEIEKRVAEEIQKRMAVQNGENIGKKQPGIMTNMGPENSVGFSPGSFAKILNLSDQSVENGQDKDNQD